jgi:hypothetical protein
MDEQDRCGLCVLESDYIRPLDGSIRPAVSGSQNDSTTSGWSPNDLRMFELDPQPLFGSWWPLVG